MGITKNHVFQSEFCPKFKYSDVKCHGFEAGIQDCSFRIEHADCDDIEHAGGIVCGTNENEGNNTFDRFFFTSLNEAHKHVKQQQNRGSGYQKCDLFVKD